jgi:hypothetical protein
MQMTRLSALFGSNMKTYKLPGWIAVGISTAISSVWAYWGIIENFHEGWFHDSLWQNLLLMFIQYLSIPIIFVLLTVIAVRWRRAGAAAFIAAAIGLGVFFHGAHISVTALLALPPVILGLLFWFGTPKPKKLAFIIPVALPLIIILGLGIPEGVKVTNRLNDGNFGARLVQGNGIELVWAPAGPGWTDSGTSWEEAQKICRYLSEDGTALEDTPQDIWRLPTVEEAVRSMSRHGVNAGGIWDSETEKASYDRKPDKETPLWNNRSEVIYYWTSTETDEKHAYIVVYDGSVYSKDKRGSASLGFRAVKVPND